LPGSADPNVCPGGAGALDQAQRFGRRAIFEVRNHESDALAGGKRRDFRQVGPRPGRGTGTSQAAAASRARPAVPRRGGADSWGNPKETRSPGQVALVRTQRDRHNRPPKKKNNLGDMAMANETHESVIGSDVEIIGTIKSSGTVRLDGKLEGELLCGGNAILGKSAQVKGNVTATSVSIEGKINGNILARTRSR
jgi:hypothetical protein